MSRALVRVIALIMLFVARPGAASAQEVEPEAATSAQQAVEPATEQAVDDRSALTDP